MPEQLPQNYVQRLHTLKTAFSVKLYNMPSIKAIRWNQCSLPVVVRNTFSGAVPYRKDKACDPYDCCKSRDIKHM
jgi:hypothetical protein